MHYHRGDILCDRFRKKSRLFLDFIHVYCYLCAWINFTRDSVWKFCLSKFRFSRGKRIDFRYTKYNKKCEILQLLKYIYLGLEGLFIGLLANFALGLTFLQSSGETHQIWYFKITNLENSLILDSTGVHLLHVIYPKLFLSVLAFSSLPIHCLVSNKPPNTKPNFCAEWATNYGTKQTAKLRKRINGHLNFLMESSLNFDTEFVWHVSLTRMHFFL